MKLLTWQGAARIWPADGDRVGFNGIEPGPAADGGAADLESARP